MSTTKTSILPLKAPQFINSTSDDNYYLKAGGGTGLISDFATSASLNGYLPLSGDATISGGLQTNVGIVTNNDRNTYIYDNLISRAFNYNSITGTILIELPTTWHSDMSIIDISLYEYGSNSQHHTKITVSGYNYRGSGGSWYGYSTTIEGGSIDKPVRLGYNSSTSKCCILIGSTTSTWSYPCVYLTKGVVKNEYYSIDSWRTGYNISLITDESNITSIVTPPISPKIAGGFIIPNGTSNQLLTADGSVIDKTSMLRTSQIVVDNDIDFKNKSLKNGGFEVVDTLPTTNLFVGRKVCYNGKDYMYNGSAWTNDAETLDGTDINDILPKLNTPRCNLGNPSVFEAAVIDAQFTNKLWFYPSSAFLFERSTDDITYTEDASISPLDLVSGNNNAYIAIPKGSCLRITITNQNNYVFLDMLYMYYSREGDDMFIKLEKYNSLNDIWTTVMDYAHVYSGWPGHMSIRHDSIPLSNYDVQFSKVRITIKADPDTSGGVYPNHHLYGMEWWGGYPAGSRHIYYWDSSKNVYFPASVQSNETLNCDVNTTAPTQTGTVTKTSKWWWQYLIQGVHFLYAAIRYLTNGYIPRWNSTTQRFENSKLYDNGTNVGIGTTSPTEALDVVGSIKSSAGFKKGDIGDTNLLLAGGGDKPISDFATSASLNGYLPLSGDATISGGLKTTLDSGQTYIYDNVASKYLGNGYATGTILIDLPNGWNRSMNIYEIELYESDSNTQHHTKIIVSGYNSSGGSWYNYSTTIEGGTTNEPVRLGYNSSTSKCCILIGSTTSTWDHTSVYLTKILSSYSNQNSWHTGYNISLITDESNITSIVTPSISPKIASGFIHSSYNSPNYLLTSDGDVIDKTSIQNYTLPTATSTTLGGVKIGSGVTISSGVISVSPTSIGLGNVNNTADANKSVNYATSAGNADTVDGVHIDGIFTNLGVSGNSITATIGGVTKSITPPFASAAANDGSGNSIHDTYVNIHGTNYMDNSLTSIDTINTHNSGQVNNGAHAHLTGVVENIEIILPNYYDKLNGFIVYEIILQVENNNGDDDAARMQNYKITIGGYADSNNNTWGSANYFVDGGVMDRVYLGDDPNYSQCCIIIERPSTANSWGVQSIVDVTISKIFFSNSGDVTMFSDNQQYGFERNVDTSQLNLSNYSHEIPVSYKYCKGVITDANSATALLTSDGGVLSTNTFASATSLNNYLPLTGGTVTGNITAKHFIQQINISTPASGTVIDDYIDTLLSNNTYIKINVNYWSSYAIHLYYLNHAIVGVPVTVVISNTGSSNASLYIYEKNNGSTIAIINKTLVPNGNTSTIRFQFIKFDDNNIIVTSAM